MLVKRRALALSLALHAGVIALVGRWSLCEATRPEPGVAGMSVTMLVRGLLPVDLAPAAPPEVIADPVPAESAPVVEARPAIATMEPRAPALLVPAVPGPVRELPPSASGRKRRAGRGPVSSPSRQPGMAKSGTDGSASETGTTRAGGGGGGYVPPQFRLRYTPPYPEQARALRLEGTVLLLVSVDVSGRVTSTSVRRSCGSSLLDRTALAAVRSWRFYPARRNGIPVAAQVEVPLSFRFEERRGSRT